MAHIKCAKCQTQFPEGHYYGHICPQCGTDSRIELPPDKLPRRERAKTDSKFGFHAPSGFVLLAAIAHISVAAAAVIWIDARFPYAGQGLFAARFPVIGRLAYYWDAFPPALIAVLVAAAQVWLAFKLLLSVFAFTPRMFHLLKLTVVVTPVLRLIVVFSRELANFPFFWGARYLGSSLPGPPLAYLFESTFPFVVAIIFEAVALRVLLRYVTTSRAANITYLHREKASTSAAAEPGAAADGGGI